MNINTIRDEYILCSAIWYIDYKLLKEIPQVRPKNIDRGIVVVGHRHGQCIWTMGCLTGLRTCTHGEDCTGEHEQGFLTNLNRFVDRKEGAEIAFAAGQIKEKKETLYSEDLY